MPGNLIGKYSEEVTSAIALNVVFLVVPMFVAARVLRGQVLHRAPAVALRRDTGPDTLQQLALRQRVRRRLDVLHLVGEVHAGDLAGAVAVLRNLVDDLLCHADFLDASKRIAERIPAATLDVLPLGGHCPQFEATDAWRASFDRFLPGTP